MHKSSINIFLIIFLTFSLIGCNNDKNPKDSTSQNINSEKEKPPVKKMDNESKTKLLGNAPAKKIDNKNPKKISSNTPAKKITKKNTTSSSKTKLTPYPESIAVVVNKRYYMPANYIPKELVYPNVPFLFKEKVEKRKMRREAAVALEKMFASAKKDKIYKWSFCLSLL